MVKDKPPQDEFPTSLHLNDFSDFPSANLTLDQDKKLGIETVGNADGEGFTVLGHYEIPRGIGIALGHRKRDLPFYIRMDSAGGKIAGQYKIVICDPTKSSCRQVGIFTTSEMDDSAPLDKTKNPTPELRRPWVLERGWLILLFKAETDDTVLVYDDANNEINIPITKKIGMYREYSRE